MIIPRAVLVPYVNAAETPNFPVRVFAPDEREAAYHGVHAVPFFVINGKYSISGAPDTEGLRQALLKLMAKEAEEQMASGMSCGPEGCKLR